jgi:hypothetical protein
MRTAIRVAASVLAVAGLVFEGIKAKEADPYFLSYQSMTMLIVFSTILFLANLSMFKVIRMNSDRFCFDEWNIAGSRSFAPAKDRSELLHKVFKIKTLDGEPPRSN